ncbi:hypothetical protein [Haladaptatus halobius]|uniref:hypothetical protein n=1 Tax=Haladaptatus halobius TaxID=2884875 RepID=UPI001D0BA4F5|nr:hypothetical protein [Haladaptatus halobius]
MRGELTSEQAYATLVEEEDLERFAAEDILERLHMRVHVYEVDGHFRLTGFLTTHLNGEHRQPDWRR